MKREKKLTEAEKWKMCDKCGDYEYCAGKYGTDECTGFIPGSLEDEG